MQVTLNFGLGLLASRFSFCLGVGSVSWEKGVIMEVGGDSWWGENGASVSNSLPFFSFSFCFSFFFFLFLFYRPSVMESKMRGVIKMALSWFWAKVRPLVAFLPLLSFSRPVFYGGGVWRLSQWVCDGKSGTKLRAERKGAPRVCPLPVWVVKSGEAKAKKLLKMMMGRHKLFLFFNSSLVLVCLWRN